MRAPVYSDGGCRDLLFHPLEAAFTLLEVREMLSAARLTPTGVFFADLEQDQRARRAYREDALSKGAAADEPHADLARWHALEERDPELFGRMHCVFARFEPGAPEEG